MAHSCQWGKLRKWAWVKYAGEPLYHHRLVSGVVVPLDTTGIDSCMVVSTSPDGDTYAEDYGDGNPDIECVKFSSVFLPPPPAIPRAQVYRFRREPSQVQCDAYAVVATSEGDVQHNVLRAASGLPAVTPGN
eukprot:6286281-Karenia_brevis.AAC.1